MFKYIVEYTISFGSISLYKNIYICTFTCKAWTKCGAWRKFLKTMKDENFYESKTYLNNFWKKRKDIKFCGV